MKVSTELGICLLLWVILLACFGTKPTEPIAKKERPGVSERNLKQASKDCKPFHGVTFVGAGDHYFAQCRDGLKVSREASSMTIKNRMAKNEK